MVGIVEELRYGHKNGLEDMSSQPDVFVLRSSLHMRMHAKLELGPAAR